MISGRGIFFINQDQLEVTAGELIHIPSHSPHQLKNFSEEDLVFISIYVPQEEVDINFTKVFITTAPPTPNGPLHLGHISGPYLVADILKRYYKQLNISVLHLSGTDDHQNYVEIKALKNQENINIFLNNRRSQILLGFEKNQIEVDHFQHPSQENLYQEQAAVSIDLYEEKKSLTRIVATIHVERDGQKAILLGKGGAQVKAIGTAARERLEAFLDGRKVLLELFVRVTPDWSTSKAMLEELGFQNEGKS